MNAAPRGHSRGHRPPLQSLQELEAEAELLVFKELAPIDEEKDADNKDASGEGEDSFPVRFAMKEIAQIGAGVFAGKHEHAVGDKTAKKKRDKDVERPSDAPHGNGGEKGGG